MMSIFQFLMSIGSSGPKKWPPLAQNFFEIFFFAKIHPKRNLLSKTYPLIPNLSFPAKQMLRYLKKKVHGLARSPNFENGIAPPLGVLGRKFFVVLNNSLGGTSGPSMSKIGDVRVPNHFDPCWNCPKTELREGWGGGWTGGGMVWQEWGMVFGHSICYPLTCP